MYHLQGMLRARIRYQPVTTTGPGDGWNLKRRRIGARRCGPLC
jgi:hypothetical protein